MKHLKNLFSIVLGVGTIVGSAMVGCGGDEVPPPTGGSSASSGSGSSGTAGSGGTGSCPTGCDDGFSCTIDSCNGGICEHVIGPVSGETACPQGQVCQLGLGCVDLIICADDTQCLDKLGADPCKTNIHCDLAKSYCLYGPLDKDNDGQSPVVCGGMDCDDSTNQTYAGATETCDGKDNNCNGTTDEAVTCPGMSTCQAGACTCPPENACGTDCVDKTTSNTHCGMCNNSCLGAASCMNGTCVCPTGAVTCSGICVDTKTDPMNCGGCAKTCASGYSCVNSLCTCVGTPCGTGCADTMNDPLNCGGCNVQCPAGLACQNGLCACAAGQTSCGGQCVNTMTNPSHCGGCNKPCNGICQNGQCTGCTVANLYLFADLSGSMVDPDSTGTAKLDAMRTGINNFLTNAASANMGVGIGYHPIKGATGVCPGTNLPCTTNNQCSPFPLCDLSTSCSQTDYQVAGAGIGLLPGNQMAITNSLAAKVAEGGSVPPPGYQGALQYAKNYAMANSTQKVAVVLLADSFPNTCTTTMEMFTDLTPLAQQFANGTPRVVTYVIGMGDGVAPNPTQAQWNSVASAGGTGTAFLVNSSAAITTALNTIRSQFKTCP